MNYDIKLSGASDDNGTIELGRLAQLIENISNIARGALQIRLTGFSRTNGKLPKKVANALKIRLSGGLDKRNESFTLLELECEPLSLHLQGLQGEIFNHALLEELSQMTPFSLVMSTFRGVLEKEDNYEWIDKPLLNKLYDFKSLFLSEVEQIQFSNRGSIPELTLKEVNFEKIKQLEEKIPNPKNVVISGRLDMIKFSTSRVSIETLEGFIQGIFSGPIEISDLRAYVGEDITVTGMGHFRSNGRLSFIEIERLVDPGKVNSIFSKIPKSETIEQQIKRQVGEKRHFNHLPDIIGKWPSDESLEDILTQID